MAVAALVAVLALCAAGLGAMAAQIRCVDAAREAARLAARGDASAIPVAQRIAPAGAGVQIRRDGQFFVATVTAGPAGLPGVTLSADAVAMVEPG
ncbi:MAG: TadE family type IV pilus minor pilin [Mycobacterium sp.]